MAASMSAILPASRYPQSSTYLTHWLERNLISYVVVSEPRRIRCILAFRSTYYADENNEVCWILNRFSFTQIYLFDFCHIPSFTLSSLVIYKVKFLKTFTTTAIESKTESIKFALWALYLYEIIIFYLFIIIIIIFYYSRVHRSGENGIKDKVLYASIVEIVLRH